MAVDERGGWWDPDRQAGRTAKGAGVGRRRRALTSLLLCYRQRRWYVEGIYDRRSPNGPDGRFARLPGGNTMTDIIDPTRHTG